MKVLAGIAVVATLCGAACAGDDLPLSLGAQCDLNSDCDTPLVCLIERCRKECSTSRDCAIGLDCVLDNDGLGACQLPEDTRCTLDSDCPDPLVCTMGECTNECACAPDEPCRDCPPGASCVERDDRGRACIDLATQTCVRNSDCEAIPDLSFVCAFDQRCRVECRSDRDCRFDDVCSTVTFDEPGRGTVTGTFCVDPLRVAPDSDAGVPSDGG